LTAYPRGGTIVVEIRTTEEFRQWARRLDEPARKHVVHAVELLRLEGVRLGYPSSSAILGSPIALRELRIQSRGRAIRIFSAFDAERRALILCGGIKTDERFYKANVPMAEQLWQRHVTGSAIRTRGGRR
jgi:hypothetical protein